MSTKQNKRRRRYNSVMDDVNEDEHDENVDVNGSVEVEMQEQRRREPEHRHLNRMRLQRENIEPVLSPEDKPSFSQIFLRKYGFGHWQLPHDDGMVKS